MASNVIIGGGPVATNAIESIREFDSDSEITLICDEPAHSRMALPYWLSGQIPREQTHTADDAYFGNLNVTTRIGDRVNSVDPTANTVSLSDGSSLGYDNLLIATGASPLALPVPGTDLPGVQPLWSLDHTANLLQATDGNDNPRIVMIGAGFIGFIMLNAMYKRGWQLTVVEREAQILPRMLDADSAGIVQSWLGQKGVDVHAGATLSAITEADDGSKSVELDNGTTISGDVVIIATGIKPNIEFLDGSGIETDEGVLVNDRMQTNFANVYAGGDIAQGPVLGSDTREIHPIQPTAVDHGRVAGANMAGQDVQYPGSLSMNILDVCGLQNSSFGNWNDPGAETMTISNPDGFIYRKLLWTGDKITGAIFTGRPNDMGMLTDVGMVKGIMQTQTKLGEWKEFLQENPFDIRRAYVANKVASKLVGTTLIGRPAKTRGFHFGGQSPTTHVASSHQVYVGTKRG